jgi:hypothetical protein
MMLEALMSFHIIFSMMLKLMEPFGLMLLAIMPSTQPLLSLLHTELEQEESTISEFVLLISGAGVPSLNYLG